MLALALAGSIARVSADPAPLNAKVVWVRGGRVYLASPDSSALEPGQTVSFVWRGKTIASGEISRVFDREMAIATLSTGSLERAKKLERLRILAERHRPGALPMLRVGYPSRSRVSLLFECDSLFLRAPGPVGMYRAEGLNPRSTRLFRETAPSIDAPWPDTLLVRQFDEAADEEIALERGELDAAVFWPGEMSSHLREQPRWRDFLSGTLRHGVVAATWSASGTARDSSHSLPLSVDSLLASLNREIFRGDLAPWREFAARSGRPLPPSTPAEWNVARFEVDPAVPGRQLLERFLNRGRKSQAARDTAAVVRLLYLDLPVERTLDSPGSFAPGTSADSRDLPGPAPIWPARTAPLFAIRCPVVAASQLLPYLAALGPDFLVGMLDCRERRVR